MPIDGFEPDAAGLQAVLRAIPELVILLDLDGRIRYLNRAERYDRDDFVGVHAHELLPPASQEVFDAALDTVTETGEPREYVVQAVLPDGEKAWYRTRMYPFPDAESMTAVLLTSIDVTEEKQKEREVKKLRTLLPICAWCDRIRDSEGEWTSIERYMEREEQTAVSHGICPECSRQRTSGLGDEEASDSGAA